MLQVEYDLRLNQYLAETKCAANIYPRLYITSFFIY